MRCDGNSHMRGDTTHPCVVIATHIYKKGGGQVLSLDMVTTSPYLWAKEMCSGVFSKQKMYALGIVG